MPYVSKAQVGYMHAKHPDIARRWDKKYGVPKNLPKHLHGSGKFTMSDVKQGYKAC